MRQFFDKKTIFRIGAAALIVFLVIRYWDSAAGLIGNLWRAVTPLLAGAVIAYLLNILMSFYERHYFTKHRCKFGEATRRGVCLTGAFLTIAAIAAVIIVLLVPQLVKCIGQLIKNAPESLGKILTNEKLLRLIPKPALEWITDLDGKVKTIDWSSIITAIYNWFKGGAAAQKIGAVLSNTISVAGTFLIGLVYAIYYLSSRDRILYYLDKILRKLFKPKYIEKIYHYGSNLNDCFHKYIVGECTAAVILGLMCFAMMLILRIPYAAMLAPLIAVMELIPYVGIALSAAVGFIMILSVSPLKALIFVIMVIVVKALEGYFIYPRIVGNSVGAPGIVVFAGITVGGSLFGILGILFSIPAATAIYNELMLSLREDRRTVYEAVSDRLNRDERQEITDHVEKLIAAEPIRAASPAPGDAGDACDADDDDDK